MPLTAFVEQQRHGIRRFVEDDATRLLVLRVDPEMERMAAKVVASFEDDPDAAWAFFVSSADFETADQYYGALAASILSDFDELNQEPQEQPRNLESPQPMLDGATNARYSPEIRFTEFLERAARAIRPVFHTTVLVLKADQISDPIAWRRSIAAMASAIDDPAVKVIVFDSRQKPILDDLLLASDRVSIEALQPSFPEQERAAAEFIVSATRRVMVLLASPHDPNAESISGVRPPLDSEATIVPVDVRAAMRPADYYRAAVLELSRRFGDTGRQASIVELDRAFAARHFAVPIETSFSEFAEGLLNLVLPRGGRLVLVFSPTIVHLSEEFRQSLERLGHAASHPRIKYIFLWKTAARVPGLAPRRYAAATQTFYIAPSEIQSGVASKLASATLSPIERMRYTAVLGGFAFSERDYQRAEMLQLEWLQQADENASGSDKANAHYNLGNTYLAREDWSAATEHLTSAVDVALDENMNALAAMAFSNLGLSLYRQQQYSMALDSFLTARGIFKSLQYRPGEVYVLDAMASVYEEASQPDVAVRLRMEALELNDSITAPSLVDGQQSIRADLLAKLNRTA